MLTIPWDLVNGWGVPKIQPCKFSMTFIFPCLIYLLMNFDSFSDGPLSLEPSSTVLHYAQTLFEGMKAYLGPDGEVRLFRPNLNMERMKMSAARIALPVRLVHRCVFITEILTKA